MYLARIALVSSLYNSLAQASNNTSNLTIALLRAPPPQWPLPIYEYDWGSIRPNLTSSVDAGIEYIKETKKNGANWILFPELWFPGYVHTPIRNVRADTPVSTGSPKVLTTTTGHQRIYPHTSTMPWSKEDQSGIA